MAPVDKGLLDIPVLYLSRYIIGNKQAYYDRLLAVTTQGAWEEWILYMLDAFRETSNWSTKQIRAIRDLLDQTGERIRRDLPKIYSRELAEVIFSIRIAGSATWWMQALPSGRPRRSTSRPSSNGLLEEVKAGRENLYINPGLLALLRDRTPRRVEQ